MVTTAAAAVWWVCCAVLHVHLQHVVEEFGKVYYGVNGRDSRPLHDTVHAACPPPAGVFSWAWNVFLEPFPFVFIALVVLASKGALIAAALLCHGWLLLLRMACFASTLLPDASQTHAYSGKYQVAGGVHSLLFSGHASTSLLAATLWVLWTDCTLCACLVYYGACAIQSVGIVLCRKHYTVDVLLAWMIAPVWTAIMCWGFHLL